MADFDYAAPAELFVGRTYRKHGPVSYKRFDSAADAIRFAVETLPPPALRGSVLEVDGERYDATHIRDLYDSDAYPLARAPLT